MTPALAAYLRDVTTRCEQATKGPWCWEATGEKSNDWVLGIAVDQDGKPMRGCLDDPEGLVTADEKIAEGEGNLGDPDFAAHARTDLPTLVRLVRELSGALEEIAMRTDGPSYHSGSDIRGLINEALVRAEAMVKEGG